MHRAKNPSRRDGGTETTTDVVSYVAQALVVSSEHGPGRPGTIVTPVFGAETVRRRYLRLLYTDNPET